MNVLEHYIKELLSVQLREIKKENGEPLKYYSINAVVNCYGKEAICDHVVFSMEELKKVLNDGFWMA